MLCADSLGLDVIISWSSSGVVGADGVLGPCMVVPGRGDGGGGGRMFGETMFWTWSLLGGELASCLIGLGLCDRTWGISGAWFGR